MNIEDIREMIAEELVNERFTIDKSGVKTVELVGTSFEVGPEDETIFGAPNYEYIDREIEWYNSMSLKVSDIPGKTPKIWEQVADANGLINSNYGFLIFSAENYNQYSNALETLKADPNSRRAIMIYTRPMMHYEYKRDGMSDFICTNTVQYFIRDGKLHAVVNMRSNDAIFGFRNDCAWQKHVHSMLAEELQVDVGTIHWQTGSLHVYERHFPLVMEWYETGNINAQV